MLTDAEFNAFASMFCWLLGGALMVAFLMLLSTEHCALCDEALSMLFSMPELAGLELRVVDVAEDDALLERYGAQVPVLQVYVTPDVSARDACAADTKEAELRLSLPWPFNAESLGRQLRSLPG